MLGLNSWFLRLASIAFVLIAISAISIPNGTTVLCNLEVSDDPYSGVKPAGCTTPDCSATVPCKYIQELFIVGSDWWVEGKCVCGTSYDDPPPAGLLCQSTIYRSSQHENPSIWLVSCVKLACSGHCCVYAGPYSDTVPCGCSSVPCPEP